MPRAADSRRLEDDARVGCLWRIRTPRLVPSVILRTHNLPPPIPLRIPSNAALSLLLNAFHVFVFDPFIRLFVPMGFVLTLECDCRLSMVDVFAG